MTLGQTLLRGGLGLCLLALVACDNAEERAAAHYAKGVELAAAGEVDKAIIEFRNALKLDQDAVPPRLEFARLQYARGTTPPANDRESHSTCQGASPRAMTRCASSVSAA